MLGVLEKFRRDHGGEMFERHGDGQIGDRRAALGEGEQFLDALVDRLDVVAMVFGQAVEGNVFARVIDFLLHEGADCRQLGIGAVAILGPVRLYCLDKGPPRGKVADSALCQAVPNGSPAHQLGRGVAIGLVAHDGQIGGRRRADRLAVSKPVCAFMDKVRYTLLTGM